MKRGLLLILATFLLLACNDSATEKKAANAREEKLDFTSYGDRFIPNDISSPAEIDALYSRLQPGDTLDGVRFKTTVINVCKGKGCWMTLDIPGEEEVMVKFNDYSFFVPKDIENKEVIVEGLAYVTEVSVDEQRHYAEDEGRSEEEIAGINASRQTRSFLARGVLIAE